MTPVEYRSALKALNLTIGGSAAKALDVSKRASKRFASARGRIPGPVARLLEMFLRHGLPEEWRSLPTDVDETNTDQRITGQDNGVEDKG
jgi:hypothetical protein